MLKLIRILVSALVPLLFGLSLGGCGQSGALYLPKVPPKPAPADARPTGASIASPAPATNATAPTTP